MHYPNRSWAPLASWAECGESATTALVERRRVRWWARNPAIPRLRKVQKRESIDSGVNVANAGLGQNGVTWRARLESASCGECRSGLGWVQSWGARGVGLGRGDCYGGGWGIHHNKKRDTPKRGTDETQGRRRVGNVRESRSWATRRVETSLRDEISSGYRILMEI